MGAGPKVSVSIVTYQQAGFVRQTVEAALSQRTDFPFEVIVGDDASTDGTQAVLREMREAAPDRLRLLLAETNHGDSGLSNFMATVDASRGEYVAFCDGDDHWTSPLKLQRQVDFLDANPDCALCCHPVEHLFDDGRRLLSPRPKGGRTKLTAQDLWSVNYAEKIATVVRRSALGALPDWYRRTDAISADWVLAVLVARTGKVGFVHDAMAVHRLHAGSLTVRHGAERMLRDKARSLRILRPYFPGSGLAFARARLVLALKLALVRMSPDGYQALKRAGGRGLGLGPPRAARSR